MLHQKETDRIRAYPTHQAVQTTGSTAYRKKSKNTHMSDEITGTLVMCE